MMSWDVYDPLSQENIMDPFPTYMKLRRDHPIFWHEGMKSWVFTRHDDCREVLRDYKRFARDRRRIEENVPEFRQNLQSVDPPEQAPVRRLMVAAFKRQDPARIGRSAYDHLAALADEAGSEIEWMSQVCAPFALTLSAMLLGVPEPNLTEYEGISEGIARRMDSGINTDNAVIGDAARHRLNHLVDQWLGSELPDGLIRSCIHRAESSGVSPHYVTNSLGVMFNASYATIYAAAGNVTLNLLRNRWILDRIYREDLLISTAADELIRIDGPAQGTSRVAAEDTVVKGHKIHRGQVIITLLASANRDENVFEDSESILLDRKPNPHLSFGAGTHACIGALFGRIAISTLIKFIVTNRSRINMNGTPARRNTATVRTIANLPVRMSR
jgi:cytochrome P450